MDRGLETKPQKSQMFTTKQGNVALPENLSIQNVN